MVFEARVPSSRYTPCPDTQACLLLEAQTALCSGVFALFLPKSPPLADSGQARGFHPQGPKTKLCFLHSTFFTSCILTIARVFIICLSLSLECELPEGRDLLVWGKGACSAQLIVFGSYLINMVEWRNSPCGLDSHHGFPVLPTYPPPPPFLPTFPLSSPLLVVATVQDLVSRRT